MARPVRNQPQLPKGQHVSYRPNIMGLLQREHPTILTQSNPPCWFERHRHSTANCSRIVRDNTMVTMDSLWKTNIALFQIIWSTTHYDIPFSQNRGLNYTVLTYVEFWMAISPQHVIQSTSSRSRFFLVSGSNGTNSGSLKPKIAAMTWNDMTEDIDKRRTLLPFAELLRSLSQLKIKIWKNGRKKFSTNWIWTVNTQPFGYKRLKPFSHSGNRQLASHRLYCLKR